MLACPPDVATFVCAVLRLLVAVVVATAASVSELLDAAFAEAVVAATAVVLLITPTPTDSLLLLRQMDTAPEPLYEDDVYESTQPQLHSVNI